MRNHANFHFQLSNVNFTSSAATAFELLIVESEYASRTSRLSLSANEIAALQAQRRGVIAYLNVSVTDHNRTYWNAPWVTPIDPDNGDVGEINQNAVPPPPDWLINNHGYAKSGNVIFGYIVDYSDPDWQTLVINQAVYLVGTLGYSGLFLDDVGRYYDAHRNDGSLNANQTADDMIAFVNRITAAVRTVKPSAYFAINGGAYIGPNSTGGTATVDYNHMVGAIDAIMMENQFDTATSSSTAWRNAKTNYAANPNMEYLAVESRGGMTEAQIAAFYNYSRTTGLLGLVTPNADYDIIQDLPPSVSGK